LIERNSFLDKINWRNDIAVIVLTVETKLSQNLLAHDQQLYFNQILMKT